MTAPRAILVVDDNRLLVRTLVDVLRLHGWQAEGAHSGEEAVAAVRATPYDLLVMDVRMTGIDGVEALRAIRAERPHLPVVLMTAYSTAELVREAERLGALALLPKPVRLPDLAAALESALREQPTVLMVDDDPDLLRAVGRLMAARAVPMERAATVAEALGLLDRGQPGVVVLDLAIDHGQPHDCLVVLRRPSTAAALILHSASPPVLASPPGPSSFSACLRKPFPPEKLLATIRAVIGTTR